MNRKIHLLLVIDCIVNLLLGLLLLLFPAGLLDYLGLPPTDTYFYTSILGGVIFGIGIALGLEWLGAPNRIRGLGLGGAIAINTCGGGTLLGWLVFGNLSLPLRGQITLWIVVVIVLGIGLMEILQKSWKYES
ncbi:MAG: hypothetical protein WBB69_03540 [Anaerolineales bacterium]